ncbi:N-acetylmuramoyl-L-alanine amidase [Burkholderia pyrrocinia]|nr:N-acetylmuramoyl-L-alanine amidase [Burkholderia pyrrocinia]
MDCRSYGSSRKLNLTPHSPIQTLIDSILLLDRVRRYRHASPCIVAALAFCVALPCQSAYIVVDTGHTPQHPGATSATSRTEYSYNLELSTAIVRDLQAGGDKVLRTSADGREIELTARSNVAPEADLFVSIHHDSIQQEWIDAGRRREFRGYSIFVSARNPQYQRSLRCAEAIGERLKEAGEQPSLYHATPIRGENRPLIDARLGIHRFDDLVVLKTATIPAVLVEAGVIANPDEEVRLENRETVARISKAIADGIDACQPKQ